MTLKSDKTRRGHLTGITHNMKPQTRKEQQSKRYEDDDDEGDDEKQKRRHK